MSALVITAYTIAFVLAIVLLRFFHSPHCHWYWHASAILLALVIGLVPPPDALAGPLLDLAVGSIFIFLVMWGAAGPLFRAHHR